MNVEKALCMAVALKGSGVVSRSALAVICLGDEVRRLRQQVADLEAIAGQPYIEPVEFEVDHASE